MRNNLYFLFFIFLLLIVILNCSQDEILTKNIEINLFAPTFTPMGGEFYDPVKVEITPNTKPSQYYKSKDIKIAYTTDGTDPVVNKDGTIVNGNLYISPITIDRFTILKAVCFVKKDGVVSNIGRTAYSFKAAYPIFTPSTGKYGLDQTVRIETPTQGATIYYTTDGSQPSQASNIYVTPLTISKPVTIRAVAYRFGWAYSETKEATFSFKPDNPNIYPNGGIFDNSVSVTLSPSLIGSEIRYTIDNTDPTNDSTLYSAPINIDSSKTLKAIAIKTGMENSDIAMAQFTLKVSKPYPSLGGGYYKNSKNVSLDCSTSGATIKYKLVDLNVTTDLTPDTNYTGPINISASKKLIAMATKTGFEDSDWLYETYIIDGGLQNAVPGPTFSKDNGTYQPFSLTISKPDPSSDIKYTLDGSTPSSINGIFYEGPIYLNRSTTVKAICFRDGYEYSSVGTRNYTIQDNVADPIISISSRIDPESYVYDDINDKYICYSAIVIEMECETGGAIIRWTSNGSDPTESDAVYNGPISIAGASGSITIKAKAFIKDWNSSNVVSKTFRFKLPKPVFNPETKGGLKKPVTIVISQPVLDAKTYYTDDESDPKTSGTKKEYTSPIPINSTKTIKAYSTLSGWDYSDVVTHIYTFE